jgi:hypothetical protein
MDPSDGNHFPKIVDLDPVAANLDDKADVYVI